MWSLDPVCFLFFLARYRDDWCFFCGEFYYFEALVPKTITVLWECCLRFSFKFMDLVHLVILMGSWGQKKHCCYFMLLVMFFPLKHFHIKVNCYLMLSSVLTQVLAFTSGLSMHKCICIISETSHCEDTILLWLTASVKLHCRIIRQKKQICS